MEKIIAKSELLARVQHPEGVTEDVLQLATQTLSDEAADRLRALAMEDIEKVDRYNRRTLWTALIMLAAALVFGLLSLLGMGWLFKYSIPCMVLFSFFALPSHMLAYREKTAKERVKLLTPIAETPASIEALQLVETGIAAVLDWRAHALAERSVLRVFDVEMLKALRQASLDEQNKEQQLDAARKVQEMVTNRDQV